MSGVPRRSLLAGALALCLAAPALVPCPARAQEAAERAEARRAQDPPDLEYLRSQRLAAMAAERNRPRTRINRYVERALEVQEEQGPEEALEILRRLDPDRLNPGEQSMIYRLLAYTQYGMGDVPEAIASFRKVIEVGVLPIDDEIDIRFNIAQLYAAAQEWEDAIAALEDWLYWVESPDPLGFYLMGIAYFQNEDVENALAATQRAIDMKEEPPESWLQLLAALHVQREDYAQALPILEQLVVRFPKKAYWVQLSLLYGAVEKYEISLAAQQIAYLQGFLTEDREIQRLARSYLFRNLPYQAAKVLEEGLENGNIEADADAYELLANSWIQAREFDASLPPLRRAAELSEDGNLYVRLGQVHMQKEMWDEAAGLLEQAVDKGGLDRPGSATLLIGICLYNGGDPERARSYFRRARDFEESREQAEVWIGHIDRELAQAQG